MSTEPALSPALILRAYANGIFPMAETRDDPEIFWVDPRERGIFPIDGFHVSRSMARRVRRAEYRATLNQDFAAVVDGCAARENTWINDTIRGLYIELHNMGHAHSLEIYEGDVLAGGVYGVSLGAAFFGESMFSTRTDGSKRALLHLIDHLRRCGFHLFDTQFLTDHLASLGAKEISRSDYRSRLASALQMPGNIWKVPLDRDHDAVLQRMTQTS
ncbi:MULTISPECIES: leucyl/phenylalanyl-tRNA--protein transferase [Roseovarius]|jgi:leucyl/phenylalanyl-tRNA--protein transferase|uniref:Leucyl/phenylalanyl-tRNA--protein transferase n=2 Tax=Roseovarius nubinhibens TaxID=314263 RepID=A3SHP9_ROSNI|nr:MULTISPECIES: leucyl/phenylalanyl-tRNA--protein transferase [Roseovarius]EAP76880.1 possible leucyl/phenylalanyl-tRNA--protein transferase [Roseovarius nubinhibens ISM]MAZ21779.1 leucyl/phenylalanyl-tRNA--protein transferase [Roseovarius sp.]MBU2998306.1 leucyl/phenylalanyl-tRNA--protein transferase [Roseovarius nubinhibens]HAR50920.1 leucyl/phenylalanyl-tRNA--protein transferase [Roseovarius nubinhibens]|tara:strand:- start:4595 stop:5242 length:648 start_codon:yes stop_codon:yes gene_type:complete